MTDGFLDRLRRDQAVFGYANTLPGPGVIECIGAGFDFVWIDAQHGYHDERSVRIAVDEAERVGVAPLVRVPGHEYSVIGRHLDTGVAGVIVPMVRSAAAARAVVEAVRFPPLGHRSIGSRRCVDRFGWGYVERDLLLIVQIEDGDGAQDAQAIAAVEGVDGLLIGAADLALHLALPKDRRSVTRPGVLQDHFRHVAETARAHGKVAGCVAGDLDERLPFALECGYRFFSCGDETGFLRHGAQTWVRAARSRASGAGGSER